MLYYQLYIITIKICLVFVIGAIQVLRNADGGGGVYQIFQKKPLQRCKVQRY